MSGAGFRWDAEEYARNSAAQLEWARELIEKLRLSGYEEVLDTGCGDGKVTAEIARLTRGRVVVCFHDQQTQAGVGGGV